MRKTLMILLAVAVVTALGGVAFADPVTQAAADETQAHVEENVDLTQVSDDKAEAEVCSAGAAIESPARVVESAGAGENCGGVVCPKFTYCCNASCSRCVPYGMSCTQESCN